MSNFTKIWNKLTRIIKIPCQSEGGWQGCFPLRKHIKVSLGSHRSFKIQKQFGRQEARDVVVPSGKQTWSESISSNRIFDGDRLNSIDPCRGMPFNISIYSYNFKVETWHRHSFRNNKVISIIQMIILYYKSKYYLQ